MNQISEQGQFKMSDLERLYSEHFPTFVSESLTRLNGIIDHNADYYLQKDGFRLLSLQLKIRWI